MLFEKRKTNGSQSSCSWKGKMEYIRNNTSFKIDEPTVLTLGKFDGLHMGHKFLFEHLIQMKKSGLKTVLFTFDRPPGNEIDHKTHLVLTTIEEKEYVFETCGIDYLIEYPFTKEVMQMNASEFIHMLVSKLNVKAIVAGDDFRFGYQRMGDHLLLEKLSKQYGFDLKIVKKKQYLGEDISSTFVRKEVISGNMELATMLLGYPYFIQGVVKDGNKFGRQMGIPTINLIPPQEKLMPPNGVYISKIEVDDQTFMGISNIGIKPTIEGKHPIGIETNLFDYQDDLYGKTVRVYFLKFLRNEKKFPSIDDLKLQIQKDIHCARKYWEEHSFDESYYGNITNS